MMQITLAETRAMSENQFKSIFVEALGLPPDVEVGALEYRQITQWDSLGHMRLVAAVESAFDIMLDTQDVLDMSSYAKAKEILVKYGITINA